MSIPNATTTALRLSPDGRIDCLYTEAIDLRVLGRLKVVRATEIAFDPASQCWEVRSFAFGGLLFSDPSREACLRWERENLGVKAECGGSDRDPHPTRSLTGMA